MWILEMITEVTGISDKVEVAEIYDVVCDNVSSFSNATRAKLVREIKSAKRFNDFLKSPAGQAQWAALEAQYGAVA